ncbi:MAG: hypothetical protein ACKO2Z_17535, partial [Sphaerospermopsis kisseleviana]
KTDLDFLVVRNTQAENWKDYSWQLLSTRLIINLSRYFANNSQRNRTSEDGFILQQEVKNDNYV